MENELIEVRTHPDGIDVFVEERLWVYRIPIIKSVDHRNWWDNHLKDKRWYTPEVRNDVLKAMDSFLT